MTEKGVKRVMLELTGLCCRNIRLQNLRLTTKLLIVLICFMNHHLANQDSRASSITLCLYCMGIQPYCHHSREKELPGNPTLLMECFSSKTMHITFIHNPLIRLIHLFGKWTGKFGSWYAHKDRKTRYWWAKETIAVERLSNSGKN